MSERRKSDKAFKLMTVELCLSGKSTTEVAAELGLRPELVSRWKREYEQRKEGSFSGHGKLALTAEQAEIARLKKAASGSRNRSGYPKKAVSIFSRANFSIHEKALLYVCH